MRAAGDGPHGRRLRALIVALWRAGLRIHEALGFNEPDPDRRRGSLLFHRGSGGRRRVRRRFAPHQHRHAHSVEMAHEGVPLIVVQPRHGNTNPGTTSIDLQGINDAEIIDTVHARRDRGLPAVAAAVPALSAPPSSPRRFHWRTAGPGADRKSSGYAHAWLARCRPTGDRWETARGNRRR